MMTFSTGWSEDFDGPGRRLVVYLKGCNFRCRWCGNPEGLDNEPVMLFYPGRTKHAADSCPHGGVSGAQLRRDKCRQCPDSACMRIARDPAFELAGTQLSVGELMDRAAAARPLFGLDGGVTFSGGEPTLQADEVLGAIDELRSRRVHTAIETNASTLLFPRFAGRVGLIIADLKCVDPDSHRKWIGADNAGVLQNLRQAADSSSDLLVRITLVTGVNDSREEMERLTGVVAGLAGRRKTLRAQVLRMHHLGAPKYAALDMDYPMKDVPCPAPETARRLVDMLAAAGISVQ